MINQRVQDFFQRLFQETHKSIWALSCLIILFFCNSLHLDAQNDAILPELKAANVTAFDIDQGLPISCTFNGFVDKDGRLWINPCFAQTEHQTVPFYHYDGITSQLAMWDSLPQELDGQAAISGLDKTGWLHGFFRKTDKFFLFNPDTYQTRIFSLDNPEAKILFTSYADGPQMIIYAISGSEHLLHALEGDSVRLLQVLQMEPNEPEAYSRSAYLRQNQFYQTQLIHGNDFWFLKPAFRARKGEDSWYSLSFVRMDLHTGNTRQLRGFTGGPLLVEFVFSKGATHEQIIHEMNI